MPELPPPVIPPPGWYPDPEHADLQRLWDGEQWTSEQKPLPGRAPDQTPEALAPAGWYPDPHISDLQRYWDGEHWTSEQKPLPKPVPPKSFLVGGWLTAVLFPIVGAIIGILIVLRYDSNQGGWIIAAAMAAGLFYSAVLV